MPKFSNICRLLNLTNKLVKYFLNIFNKLVKSLGDTAKSKEPSFLLFRRWPKWGNWIRKIFSILVFWWWWEIKYLRLLPVVHEPRILTHLRLRLMMSKLTQVRLSQTRSLIQPSTSRVELSKIFLLLLVTKTFNNIFRKVAQSAVRLLYGFVILSGCKNFLKTIG